MLVDSRPSPRALITGFVLAIGLCAMNSYLTLSFGVIEEGPTIAALLFFAVFFVAKTRITTTEMVIVATMGSAGGSLGFISNFYAARTMTGEPFSLWEAAAFATVTSLLGMLFVIPLRDLLILREDLPWPGAKATQGVITALVDAPDRRQPAILAVTTLLCMAYVVLNDDGGVGLLPSETVLPVIGAFGASIAWSPFAIGGAYLMGFSTCVGFFFGGLVLLLMAPYTPEPGAPHHYIWPGIGFLVAGGLTNLALNWRVVAASLRSLTSLGTDAQDDDDPVLSRTALAVLAVVALGVTAIFSGIVLGMNVVAILGLIVVGGFLQNVIATRAAAQTAFNPARVMGVLMEGITAATGMPRAPDNLVGAGFVAGSGAQAGNLAGDMAYGRWYHVPSRWQFWAQFVTVLPCAFVSAWVFTQIEATQPVDLTGGSLAAPVAKMWATTALVFDGSTPMPAGAMSALAIGAVIGAAYTLIEQLPPIKGWLPASMGIGLGLVLPIGFDWAFFLGGVLLWIVLGRGFKVSELTLTTLAVGAIVAEGFGGVLKPILTLAGIL
ncbi:MAG: OPT/YSL family transporter [Myxococcota bacterium]